VTTFFAHSGKKQDGTFGDWQLLSKHLLSVAQLATHLARESCPGDTALEEAARAAGLLHDLGKYRDGFQRMIRGFSVPKEATYHKQAGAVKAALSGHVPVALAIAGHHGGLPDKAKLASDARDPANRTTLEQVWQVAPQDCPPLSSLTLPQPCLRDAWQADLFTRVLFSCLVDADWTDTAEHARRVKGLNADPKPPPLDAAGLLARVLTFIAERAKACDTRMGEIRDEILRACLDAATLPPGLFALTVPTGGGKTLSGLAFALKHAATHALPDGRPCLRRLIYVAPYLSILDQNARVFRQALGVGKDDPMVFEHHSLAEPPGDENENATEREAAARRAENWDAPVVLTTSVQLLESLFANRPGRCRKFHNIARSVVLLDECQTLPPGLVAPTCALLKQLTADPGASVVLCTATQPAFDHPDMCERLEGIREIIPEELRRQDGRDLFVRLRRVQVAWPKKGDAPLDWPEVAERVRAGRAALCVVNTRRAARELFAELKRSGGDAFHLSTSMCPAHRLAVLDEVRGRLEDERPCYLVSTQLIEAGVDVDFPAVMRELAPLEAIIQAAGRCNRDGHAQERRKQLRPGSRTRGESARARRWPGTLPGDRGWPGFARPNATDADR
jgi:CRISPR-associated endonuclease/helicase Cas3